MSVIMFSLVDTAAGVAERRLGTGCIRKLANRLALIKKLAIAEKVDRWKLKKNKTCAVLAITELASVYGSNCRSAKPPIRIPRVRPLV